MKRHTAAAGSMAVFWRAAAAAWHVVTLLVTVLQTKSEISGGIAEQSCRSSGRKKAVQKQPTELRELLTASCPSTECCPGILPWAGQGCAGCSSVPMKDALPPLPLRDEELGGWYFTSVLKATCYFAK